MRIIHLHPWLWFDARSTTLKNEFPDPDRQPPQIGFSLTFPSIKFNINHSYMRKPIENILKLYKLWILQKNSYNFLSNRSEGWINYSKNRRPLYVLLFLLAETTPKEIRRVPLSTEPPNEKGNPTEWQGVHPVCMYTQSTRSTTTL